MIYLAVSIAMDAVPMDTVTPEVTPDIEALSKNLYASLDPSLSNDDRTIVYQVRTDQAVVYLGHLNKDKSSSNMYV